MTISTEQFISINVGSVANDGTGDSLRDAFIKVNENFANISDIGFDAGNINVQGSLEAAGNVTTSANVNASAIYASNYYLPDGSVPLDAYPFNAQFDANVVISSSYVPTANTSPGTAGQIIWDSGYLYICVATNSWKRANISTW
jgi:hypothetical protein